MISGSIASSMRPSRHNLESSTDFLLPAEMQNMSTIKTKNDTRSTMPERTAGLRKPQVLLAGAFAGRLLPTIRQRFAVQTFGNEFIDLSKIDFTNVSLAVFFGYGYRIAEQHLNKTIFINLHGSLLPLGRGPQPHIWNWIDGDPHGVTIHKMSAEIDKGPIMVQRKVELEPCEHSINSTMYALVDAATELFRENWIAISEGTFSLKETDALGSSHSLKDTRQIQDLVKRLADAPVSIFLQEVRTRMSGLAYYSLSAGQIDQTRRARSLAAPVSS
jgi:hypothetical protein